MAPIWKNILKCLPSAPLCVAPLPLEQEDCDENQQNGTTSSAAKDLDSRLSDSKHLSTTNSSLFVASSAHASTSSSESDADSAAVRMDLSAITASNRFFFSSPGQSNSIIESKEALPQSPKSGLSGGVAVKKYSPDPHEDFKLSMLEMIEARKQKVEGAAVDWEYLQELLSCYFMLNPKQTHKFILSAFSDIIVSLSTSPTPAVSFRCDSAGELHVV